MASVIVKVQEITKMTNSMIQVYGIPNCGSVKKARQYFEAHGIGYTFIDFKKQPVDSTLIDEWLSQVDWTILVNKKGTTYRNLPEAEKEKIKNADSAKAIMISNNSIIKRPVVVQSGKVVAVGFDEDTYTNLFQK